MATRSTYTEPERARRTAPADAYEEEPSGWVMFAAVMLLLVGILNFIYGIAAIDSASFYINDARYVFSDLSTWGWIILFIGAFQFIAACSLFMGASFGRWVGILTAGANAIAQLLFLPGYPWLSIALFSVDVLVLYGLIAHWHERQTA